MKLLIVESPAKAKTIEKYLGADWRVIASVGHIRGLVPKDGSIDIAHSFAPKWYILPGKEKQIKLIEAEAKKADAIYLATDPDREGEGISWHLLQILKDARIADKKPIYRVTYNEITKKAVMDAVNNPREIDQNLVDAYLVRLSLDYLIGFGVSPLLFRRNLGKSAGRVQSVAVKMVVDREREIEAFNPVEYWSLQAECEKFKVQSSKFNANLTKFNNEKIEKLTIQNKEQMDKILGAFSEPISGIVSSVEKKKTSRRPAAPFTTSTLQQEAARKLHFSSKRTMSAAQKLYEAGLITYMRTDATSLSMDAVSSIREHISREFGDKFLPAAPNVYITKSKNAQEAHEAIRPTSVSASVSVSGDEAKLYDLILKRTIACQMTNAEFDSVVVDIESGPAIFHAVGTTRTFDGFLKVYIEGNDDPSPDGAEASNDDNESKLPPLAVGDNIDITKLIPEQHFTAAPPRYTEASLVKKLEELGIGRPSTYAGIMSTIVDRNYVEKDKQHRFHPTDGGWIVATYLAQYFKDLMDVNFTAKTEDAMDDVVSGEQTKFDTLQNFWRPTSAAIESAKGVKTSEIINELNKSLESHLFKNCDNKCPKCGGKLGLKFSKFGAFIGCENYPECNYTMRLDTKSDGIVHEDDCPVDTAKTDSANIDLGDGIMFKVGRFGPYVTDGTKNASAKKETADTITLEKARELLAGNKKAEAKDLGENPTTGAKILYYSSGRYGPYISSNKVNVSVKDEPSLDEAIELINNKKSKPKFKK